MLINSVSCAVAAYTIWKSYVGVSCMLVGCFLFNNQPDALIIQIYFVIKLYMFRASSLPPIRSFLLRVRMELQFHPYSAWKQSSETCMKITSAECTVENS